MKSGASAIYNHLQRLGLLDDATILSSYMDDGLISQLQSTNLAENIPKYKHFAAMAEIVACKGKLTGTTLFAPGTVLEANPLLKRVVNWIIASRIPPGASITSLKFLSHNGQGGTIDDPIEIGDPYDNGLNRTPPHHDYHCLRISPTELLGCREHTVSTLVDWSTDCMLKGLVA